MVALSLIVQGCFSEARRRACTNAADCGEGYSCELSSGLCIRLCDNPRLVGANCDVCIFDGATPPLCVICGDSIVDTDQGELCDDGNRINGDGCDNNCTPTSCGNEIITDGEQCDDGNLVREACAYGLEDCTVCGESCTESPGVVSFCGDGLVDSSNGEECDDQNTDPRDGCLSDCLEAKPEFCTGVCDVEGTIGRVTRLVQTIPNEGPPGSTIKDIDINGDTMAISSEGYGLYNCPGGAGRTGISELDCDKMLSEINIYERQENGAWLHQSKIENNERVYFGDEVHLVDGGLAVIAGFRYNERELTDYFVVGRGYFFIKSVVNAGKRLLNSTITWGLGHRAATPLFWVIRSIRYRQRRCSVTRSIRMNVRETYMQLSRLFSIWQTANLLTTVS